MTDCPNVEMREALPELLHDALGADERLRVESHLATCAACTAEYELLRSARAVLSHVRVPAVDTAAIVRALPRPAVGRPAAQDAVAPARRRASPLYRIAAVISFISLGGISIAVARSNSGENVVVAVDTAGNSAAAVPVAPPVARADSPSAPSVPNARFAVHPSLNDLNDAELESLLGELETLEAAPLAEPETTPGGRAIASASTGS